MVVLVQVKRYSAADSTFSVSVVKYLGSHPSAQTFLFV